MNDFDVTGTDFHLLSAVELRKFAAKAGVKGASKGKKADLIAALEIIESEQIKVAEDAAKAAAKQAPKRNADGTLKGKCADGCGRPITKDVIGPELCTECLEYAEAENSHNDHGHEDAEFPVREELTSGCPVCHPELDPRNVVKTGRSRAGMVIIAKGTEVHKSLAFKRAAEAAGWTVEISTMVESEVEKHTAVATRTTQLGADDVINLVWNGRAYDYPASSAFLKGKVRKVRNLKEALRII